MDHQIAQKILDYVVGQVFGYQNPFTLDHAVAKFAFDVRLPQQVYDAQTGEPTWAASMSDNRYLKPSSVEKQMSEDDGLRLPRTFGDLNDVVSAWNEINYAMSERQIGSTNILESDGVYHSNYVYRSVDIRKSNNILLSDGVDACENIVAGQTSRTSKDSIRIEDSKHVERSFNVTWSNKITNSMFIRDCYDLDECLFCTHLTGKRFCVANVQLEEAEYRRIKQLVIRWVLTS